MMKYDLTRLTFLDDPTAYHVNPDDAYALVPGGLADETELITILKAQLPLPAYCSTNWNSLSEVLCSWPNWTTLPRRALIIHQDLPFLGTQKNGWFPLKIYLKVLMESIAWLHKASLRDEPQRELVVIFPSHTAAEIASVLTHPPAWETAVGFRDDPHGLLDPSWSEVQHELQKLDGVIADYFMLWREGTGAVEIHYLPRTRGYCLLSIDAQRKAFMAAPEEIASFPSELSFSAALRLLEHFFTTGQVSDEVYWVLLPDEDYHVRQPILTLRHILNRLSYRHAEEALLELVAGGMARQTIINGVLADWEMERPAAHLEYWQTILHSPHTTICERLMALCVLGLSDLPDAPTLLRPFLNSSEKQERWVSARFLGMRHEEQALSTLLSMLTDELPIMTPEHQGWSWYDNWRFYAPYLLRHWQTPAVLVSLRDALATWFAAEPTFDPEYEIGTLYEAELCYELGYREDFFPLKNLPITDNRRHRLMVNLARVYFVKHTHLDAEEEYDQRKYFWRRYTSLQEDFVAILCSKCAVSREKAQAILKAYREEYKLIIDLY